MTNNAMIVYNNLEKRRKKQTKYKIKSIKSQISMHNIIWKM